MSRASSTQRTCGSFLVSHVFPPLVVQDILASWYPAVTLVYPSTSRTPRDGDYGGATPLPLALALLEPYAANGCIGPSCAHLIFITPEPPVAPSDH